MENQFEALHPARMLRCTTGRSIEDNFFDLTVMLTSALTVMTPSQKIKMLTLFDDQRMEPADSAKEFEGKAVIEEIRTALAIMEQEVAKGGFEFKQGEEGFYWESDDSTGSPFDSREDAVEDAFLEHLNNVPN